MAHSRAPSLGLVLYLLKNSTADFFQFHQSHRQSLGKLQSLEQLPPEELKEVILDGSALPEVPSITCSFHNCFVLAVVPRPGVRHWRGGENLIGAEEPPGQETPGPADQQQSQAAGALLLYPSTRSRWNSRDDSHPPHRSSALTFFLLDVIETCLFVLWRHLEYYLLHCTPSDPKDSVMPGAALFRSRLTDSTDGSSTSLLRSKLSLTPRTSR